MIDLNQQDSPEEQQEAAECGVAGPMPASQQPTAQLGPRPAASAVVHTASVPPQALDQSSEKVPARLQGLATELLRLLVRCVLLTVFRVYETVLSLFVLSLHWMQERVKDHLEDRV